MNRALPASLLIHALFLALLLLFGSRVVRQPLPRQRAIAVRLAELPSPRPQVQSAPPPPVEEPATRPAVVPKADQKKPAAKPEAKPAAKPEVKPTPKPAASASKPAAPADAATAAVPDATAPRLGTDVQVAPQFQYYLDLLEQRVARNWQPKRLGFRSGAPVVCAVHFQVEPGGRLTRLEVTTASGVPLMDREALRAVQAVGTFLPIPTGMAGRGLGITYIFTLTAGN